MKNKKEEKKEEKKEKKEESKEKSKKRTKTDEYYDEVKKENKIIEEIKNLKEEKKTQDKKNKVEKKAKEEEEVIAKKIPIEKKKLSQTDLILLNIQLLMSICTLVVGILYFIKNNMLFWLQLSLGITMLTMGINNLKIYKRKSVTIMYFLLGILLVVLAVLTKIGF